MLWIIPEQFELEMSDGKRFLPKALCPLVAQGFQLTAATETGPAAILSMRRFRFRGIQSYLLELEPAPQVPLCCDRGFYTQKDQVGATAEAEQENSESR